MKKKIIVAIAFCALILATTIAVIVAAADTYRMEMNDPAIDILEGLGAGMIIVVGGCVVFYECDLFYTTYYLLCRQKRKVKTALIILANVALLLILVYIYLSDLPMCMELRKYENIPLILFVVYLVLKMGVLFFSTNTPGQESE